MEALITQAKRRHTLRRVLLAVLVALSLWPATARADIDLNGTSEYLATGLALSNFITAAAGTFLLWATPLGAEPTFTCNAGGANGMMADEGAHFKIVRRNSGLLCIGNNDGAVDTAQIAYTAGVPTHIALVHTGGNILMYKDGVSVAGSTASGDTAVLTQLVRVGGGPTAIGFAQMRVHSACTYNVGLEADEIAAIAGSKRYIIGRTQPTACWTLGQCGADLGCTGATLLDWSGAGRHLTPNNGIGRGSTVLTYNPGMQ